MPDADLDADEQAQGMAKFDRIVDEHNATIVSALLESTKKHALADLTIWLADPNDAHSRALVRGFRPDSFDAYDTQIREHAMLHGKRPVYVLGLERRRAALEAQPVSAKVCEALRRPPGAPNEVWCVMNLDGMILCRPYVFHRFGKGGSA